MTTFARPMHQVRAAPPAWIVPASAAAAVAARVPFIGHAAGPDEAGFLLVGAQWDGPGSSLYGGYWVDRPPLLVTIFRFVSFVGGIPALRVIGCIAVLLIVLGVARAARLVAGERAARWSAVTAAALCTSPLMGGYHVNGELLAAPFVLGGIIAVIHAVRATTTQHGVRWAVLAGVASVCAVLVKQNFADVAVFGAVVLVVSWLRSEISRRRFLTLCAAAIAGAVVALAVAAIWTVAHGTSLRGVFDAMYPFRVQAGQVIASGGRAHATIRLHALVVAATICGATLLMALAVVDAALRRQRTTVSWGLLALLVFSSASIAMGGNFWAHYLIGLIVPVSILAGELAAPRRLLVRPVIAWAVVAAVLSWGLTLNDPAGSKGETVGSAVGAVARPGDTIVHLFGHADVVLASGLTSPYEHLWSLPVKTLDPHLTGLDAVLSGPDAPTWLVTGRSLRTWGLTTRSTAAIIARDYRKIDTIAGSTIYLHDGVDRPAPHTTSSKELSS